MKKNKVVKIIGITGLAALATVASMSLGVCSVLANDANPSAYAAKYEVVKARDGRVVDMGDNYGRDYGNYDQPVGDEGYTVGRIEACINGSIVVNNIKMSISDETQVPEDVELGYLVKVDWKKNSDDSIAATCITSYGGPREDLVISSDGRVVDTGDNYGRGFDNGAVETENVTDEKKVVMASDGRVVDMGNNYGRGYSNDAVKTENVSDEKKVVTASDGRVVDMGDNFGRGFDNDAVETENVTDEKEVVTASDGRVVDMGDNYGRGFDKNSVENKNETGKRHAVTASDGRVADTGDNYGRGFGNEN